MEPTPALLGRGLGVDDGMLLPLNSVSAALEKARVVPLGSGYLYGFTITNTNAAARFVMLFDASSVPATGAVPILAKSVPAGDAVGFQWWPPRAVQVGIVVCNSTTQATLTLGAADSLFDVQYL